MLFFFKVFTLLIPMIHRNKQPVRNVFIKQHLGCSLEDCAKASSGGSVEPKRSSF